ncbi:MAG TPA: hypothetical protein VHV52_12440 [Gaiellaceae bacterium]|nr:hypothetical protein [Gaiellaceae bacterium]
MFSPKRKLTKLVAIGATAVVLGGGAFGVVSATSGSGSATATAASSSSLPFASHGGKAPEGAEFPKGGGSPEGGGSNARSGPAAGGAIGTVESVSSSGFTMTTPAGQAVTVADTSAGTVKQGESVLVLGTTEGTEITATQVTVQPAGAEPSSTAAEVVPFQQGSPSASKEVGQIPADYSEGSGTIVGGSEANEATEAALAAYPGGVVDRVVKLSDGEYEVHNIGVNWPHHVFVSQSFKVVGAD